MKEIKLKLPGGKGRENVIFYKAKVETENMMRIMPIEILKAVECLEGKVADFEDAKNLLHKIAEDHGGMLGIERRKQLLFYIKFDDEKFNNYFLLRYEYLKNEDNSNN